MIHRLQLLRNIGQFDNVAAAAAIALTRLTLVYAENGRGKTTLSAILRSLATGDTIPVTERHRLAATHAPHIIVECVGGPPAAMCHDGAWNRTLPDIAVFDDVFVDQNVCSGLAVDPAHRQNLHELILGAQGVALNRQLQQIVEQIERHNSTLRTRAEAIPATSRGGFTVDQFCELQPRQDIDASIQESERNLAAVRAQDPIRTAALFDTVSLPLIDADAIDLVLAREVTDIDAAAVERVRSHFSTIGRGGEEWIVAGMARVPAPSHSCPFCAQDLAGSAVFTHYRAYFSAEYTGLLRAIGDALTEFNRQQGGDMQSAFERAVRVVSERHAFWSRFCELPEVAVDTAEIARAWRAAREGVVAAIQAKQASPLDRQRLSTEVRAAITTYQTHRQAIEALSGRLTAANQAIRLVKEQAAGGNAAAIAADLARLQATKARHTAEIAPLCDRYLAEKTAKTQTERQRDQVKEQLDHYRQNVFPAYETAVNLYLQRFNAGFRLGNVAVANTRAGPACNYSVLINNTPVAIGAAAAGGPSFRNTLSSGDRNTLALAFFFACLDQDPALATKVVVIDDPITSLDDHRALTTVQQTRRLVDRVSQVIALSHNKSFLCRLWEDAPPNLRTALEVARDGAGSTIRPWDVSQDCISEHDRRHALLRDHTRAAAGNTREVARAIRPTIEAYLRVACPEYFPPGTLLGPFRNLCEQRIGTAQQILDRATADELRDLTEYANRFHHDTNAAWETEVVNDAELLGFVQRTLAFVRP
ncbi:MAG: AAA family ATPase [Planctomycetia bacterium]|nr:MAG: AAA family ATPase [Planctomycetia bacterium]